MFRRPATRIAPLGTTAIHYLTLTCFGIALVVVHSQIALRADLVQLVTAAAVLAGIGICALLLQSPL